MSALPSLPEPLRPRALRFRRAVTLALPPAQKRFYTCDDLVPCPPSLERYLREPRAYARLLASLWEGVERTDRRHRRGDVAYMADMATLRALTQRNCADEALAPLILRMCPPQACAWCGGEYLGWSRRVRYCGDRCRRAAVAGAERARAEATG